MIYVALNNSPYYGGGVEQVVAQTLPHLKLRPGQELTILCNDPDQPDRFDYAGYPAVNLRAWKSEAAWAKTLLLPQLAYSRKLGAYLRTRLREGDTVHVHGIEYLPFLRFRTAGVRLLLTAHGSLFEQYTVYLVGNGPSLPGRLFFWIWRWYVWLWEKWALRLPQEIVCITPHILEFCRRRYRLGQPMRVIPNGMPEGKPYERPSKQGTGVRLLIVGSRPHLKGLDIALGAVERLRKDGQDVSLVIVGFADYRPSSYPEGVVYQGRVAPSDMAAWYRDCDILLMPSRFEGLPLTVLEALQARMPVLASPVCHLEALDPAALCSQTVIPYDADAWASAIASLIDPVEYNRRSQACRKIDLSPYSWERIGAEYSILYENYAS